MHLIIVFNPLNYTTCSLLYNFKVGKVLYNTSDSSNYKLQMFMCSTLMLDYYSRESEKSAIYLSSINLDITTKQYHKGHKVGRKILSTGMEEVQVGFKGF